MHSLSKRKADGAQAIDLAARAVGEFESKGSG
jgi:hypothetical protein